MSTWVEIALGQQMRQYESYGFPGFGPISVEKGKWTVLSLCIN